jgi:hypothetical protein
MGSFKVVLLALALTAGLQAGPPPPPPGPPGFPGPPPRGHRPPPPDARGNSWDARRDESRAREIERTELLIRDLRVRLQRLGEAEAEHGDDAWWDLPSRRRRQFRLRQLRFLRERLEDAQAHLIELQGPERPLEDKPISGTARP